MSPLLLESSKKMFNQTNLVPGWKGFSKLMHAECTPSVFLFKTKLSASVTAVLLIQRGGWTFLLRVKMINRGMTTEMTQVIATIVLEKIDARPTTTSGNDCWALTIQLISYSNL